MENNNLRRQLSPMHVWAIAFGCVIGWGSFINPGKKFLPNSGVAGTAIAMILGALVMIVIAFSYAYMVPKYPSAGEEFSFAKNCFGKRMAFLCGWFLVVAYLTNVPMNSTAIGLIVDGLDGNAGPCHKELAAGLSDLSGHPPEHSILLPFASERRIKPVAKPVGEVVEDKDENEYRGSREGELPPHALP